LKSGGLLVVTTRSPGFPLHSYPYDFWRFTIDDFKAIFSDMKVLRLVEDPQAPGVLFAGIKICKTHNVSEIPIQSILQSKPPRKFTAWFKKLLLGMPVLILGFEHPIITELMAMAHRCKIERDFIRCKDYAFKFTKMDVAYYIKSLAKGSESRTATLRYLSYRKRFNPFLIHVIYLVNSVATFIKR